MQLAIVAPLDVEVEWQRQSQITGVSATAWHRCALRQILSLARFLRDNSNFEPHIICCKNSAIAREATRHKLPVLSLRTGRNPLDAISLWRWQKKIPQMLILNMGQTGLSLACRLQGMRKKNSTPLICSFLLQAPRSDRKFSKKLAKSNLLIGGSSYIIEQIAVDMDKHARMAWPGSAIVAPGIAEEAFCQSSHGTDIKKGNFVFGMAEALSPGSGALLVVRAMAAVWQKDGLPPFEVRMFGSGFRFDEIMEEARNLGVINRLSILSEQNLEHVVPLCDAWLAPGSSQNELPETLWAGFAASIPVICTQSELHKERLADALPHAVIRIAENDPQKLARAMISVMADSDLREKLVLDASSMLDQASLYRMAREFKSILESVSAVKASRPKDKNGMEDPEDLPEIQNGMN